jgi:hypothetical protein
MRSRASQLECGRSFGVFRRRLAINPEGLCNRISRLARAARLDAITPNPILPFLQALGRPTPLCPIVWDAETHFNSA